MKPFFFLVSALFTSSVLASDLSRVEQYTPSPIPMVDVSSEMLKFLKDEGKRLVCTDNDAGFGVPERLGCEFLRGSIQLEISAQESSLVLRVQDGRFQGQNVPELLKPLAKIQSPVSASLVSRLVYESENTGKVYETHLKFTPNETSSAIYPVAFVGSRILERGRTGSNENKYKLEGAQNPCGRSTTDLFRCRFVPRNR